MTMSRISAKIAADIAEFLAEASCYYTVKQIAELFSLKLPTAKYVLSLLAHNGLIKCATYRRKLQICGNVEKFEEILRGAIISALANSAQFCRSRCCSVSFVKVVKAVEVRRVLNAVGISDASAVAFAVVKHVMEKMSMMYTRSGRLYVRLCK